MKDKWNTTVETPAKERDAVRWTGDQRGRTSYSSSTDVYTGTPIDRCVDEAFRSAKGAEIHKPITVMHAVMLRFGLFLGDSLSWKCKRSERHYRGQASFSSRFHFSSPGVAAANSRVPRL
jgi:hypothetical protein